MPTTINKFLEFSSFEGFQTKWETYEEKILSTRAYALKDGMEIEDLLDFFNGIAEITDVEKLREFGGNVNIFDEEFLLKILIVNEKKVQFQMKGNPQTIISKILSFFVFLYCQ